MNDEEPRDTWSGEGDEHAVCVNCHEEITREEKGDLWFRPNVDWTSDYNVLCAGLPQDHPDYRTYSNRGNRYYNRHIPADKFVMWCIQVQEAV